MTWHTDKMAWAKAVAHVANILGSEDHAVDELMQLVNAGAIAAFDRCVVNGSISEIKLTPKYLQRNATAIGIIKAGKRARGDTDPIPAFLFNNSPGDHHVFLSRAGVLKFWPIPEETSEYPLKDARGKRADFAWEKILIEAFMVLWEDGSPEDQNTFINKVHIRCTGRAVWKKDKDPGRTQMIEHLAPPLPSGNGNPEISPGFTRTTSGRYLS
jgi:hypothetical protein